MTLVLLSGAAMAQTPVLELSAEQIGTNYPKQLSEDDAAKVFELADLTIAVRINTKATSGRKALFATSDPTQAANTNSEGTSSRYVGYGIDNANVGYLASWKNGDKFTKSGITANTEDLVVVYVINPTAVTYKMFVNGVNKGQWVNSHTDGFMNGYEIATPAMVKENHTNANIYIGGAVNSNGEGEVFDGTITGVKVYDGALTDAQIAEITALSFEDQEQLAAARVTFDAAYSTAGEIVTDANLQVTSTTPIGLQTSDPNAAYYVWCNNPEATEGPIADLVDGSTTNFFHTNWHGGGETPHYIEVDLGESNKLSEFAFGYHTRDFSGGGDFPDAIQILGSNDKESYTEVYNVSSGLPQARNTSWTSGLVSSETAYRYYRFVVTAERTYWHMAEFDIYKLEYTINDSYADVAKEVNNLATLYTTHTNNTNYTVAKLNNATETLNSAIADIAYTLKVGDAGYATLILGYNTYIPENIEAYIVTEIKNGYVTLTQVTGALPANEAVIIKADADNYYFIKTNTAATADFSGNLLEGTVANEYIYIDAYVLGVVDGVVGLYKAEMNQEGGTAWLNNANKAYLPAPTGSSAASYSFRFGEGTTGIEEITENGEQSTVIYDLTGRRVEAITAPGIYVVNGKKVLVK